MEEEPRTQTDPNPSEDMFHSSLNLEKTHLRKGYEEGYNHGLTTGKQEALQVGLRTGFQVGKELGFYRGCVYVWNSVIWVDPGSFSARVKKNIEHMEALIEKYPVLEPEDEGLQEIMDGLRLKFRVVRAALGVKLEYDGYPKPNVDEF